MAKPLVLGTTGHPTEAPFAGDTDLAEVIRDVTGATLVAGTNVTITPNDAGDTITIAATGGGGGGDPATSVYVIVHGSDPNVARTPAAGYALVVWVGTVHPVNSVDGDVVNRTDRNNGPSGAHWATDTGRRMI